MFNREYFTLAGLVSLAIVAAASPLSTHSQPLASSPKQLTLAPIHTTGHTTITNSYIVVLKDDITPADFAAHTSFAQDIHAQAQATDDLLDEVEHGMRHVYDSHIKGYSGVFSQSTVDKIRSRPEVDFVEADQVVHTMKTTIQRSAPWGLARISHREKLKFGTFTTYEYEEDGGSGVNVYVIDTGINIKHVEFEGRAHWGTTVPLNEKDIDGNGHGTHCAGTIASRAFGVAKAAHVIAVKVLGSNGSGSMSDVIKGVIWASEDASAKALQASLEFRTTGKTKHKGSVANMSLGGSKSLALDRAVNGAVDHGLHFAVAAGNDNKDACDFSPAAAEKAVTVGASTLSDERAYFSNFGPCVDVFAPGLNVLSTWTGSNHSVNTMSGTSMASPHTAGLLAYLLSIYPSTTFNPDVTGRSMIPPSLLETVVRAHPTLATMQRVYSLVYAALPPPIATWFPVPQSVPSFNVSRPVPPPGFPTLSPEELKDALIELATEGVIKPPFPRDTPNLLIFNNASASEW